MAVTERRRVELTGETLVAMWERMVLIRAFEETTGRQFADGQIPGFVHLYVGRGGGRRRRLHAPQPTTTTSPAPIAATATASPRASTSPA